MMTRLSSHLILVLFLLYSPSFSCFEHKIDLERCKAAAKDATCFVRESCIKTEPEDPEATEALKRPNLIQLIDQELKDNDCDVIMQIKPFTSKKWHVMMQVKKGDAADAKDLKSEEGISFKQNDELIFGCKDGNTGGGKFTADFMGNRQDFSPSLMFCSITIEDAQIFHESFSESKYNTKSPVLSFKTDEGDQSVTSPLQKKKFWNLPKEMCEVGNVHSDLATTSSNYKLFETDTTLTELNCADQRHSLLIRFNNEELFNAGLRCDTSNDKYVCYKKDTPDAIVPIDLGTDIKAHCAQEFCSLCNNLEKSSTCPECTPPIPVKNGNCKTATCPDNKWRHADGSITVSTVECRATGQNTAGWFMLTGDKADPISDGSCSKNFDCFLYSGLVLDCPSGDECVKATKSDDRQFLSCPPDHELNFGSKTAGNLTCNPEDGLYYSPDKTASAAVRDNVYCKKSAVDTGASTSESKGGSGVIIGVVVTIIVVILIVVIVGLFLIRRRRQEAAAASKTSPASLVNTEEMKTAAELKSKESRNSKSQSGSEAPPSTDRPSKEKMPDSNEKEKKEEKKEEKKVEKKEEKKEEKKKEEKKEPKKVKTETKEEEDTKEDRRPMAEEVRRESLALKKALAAAAKPPTGPPPPLIDPLTIGKRVNYADLTVAQIEKAKNPGDLIKYWDDKGFFKIHELVSAYSEYNRLYFLRNLTVFTGHKPSGTDPEFGTIPQFFAIVRECYEREIECQKTWEFVFRLVKLFCYYLPQKEAAAVIKRMKDMMVKIAMRLIDKQGFIRRRDWDTCEMIYRREFAIRVLVWAEDPEGLEEIQRLAEAEEPDLPVQSAVYSFMINKQDKKADMEAKFKEEIKQRKANPQTPYRFGSTRQHLIFALATDEKGKIDFLTKLTEVPEKREIDLNPTETLAAFKGATESCAKFEEVLKLFGYAIPDSETMDAEVEAIVNEYAKTADEKDKLRKQLKKDILEVCTIMAENCVTSKHFHDFYTASASALSYTRELNKEDFDAKKAQDRAENLAVMFKNKKCIEWLEEGLKKFEEDREAVAAAAAAAKKKK